MARALKERYVDTTATTPDAPRPVQLYDTPRPRSKTSIGRLSYTVSEFPKLLVLNFKVECEGLSSSEDSGSEELVWGHLEGHNKLRRLAVAECLAAKDQPYDFLHVLKDNGVVQAIFRVRDDKHKTNLQSEWTDPNTVNSVLTKNSRKEDGSVTQERIRVSVVGLEKETRETSFDYLKLLIHRSPGEAKSLRPLHGLPKTTDVRLQKQSDDIISPLPLYVQARSSIANAQDTMSIHMDFDLVGGITTMPLPDLLSALLGTNEPKVEDVARQAKAIKRIFSGLTVRCNYKPEGKSDDGRAKVQILSSKDSTGRIFQIQDIAMFNDSKTQFKVGGRTASVYDYFSNVKLSNGRSLNANYPLAQDHTGAWIPLELLTSEGLQQVHGIGHCNDTMRNYIQDFIKKGGVDCLIALGNDVLKDHVTIKTENGTDTQRWLEATSVSKVDFSSSVKSTDKIKIVSLLPEGIPDTELVKRLTSGLFSCGFNVSEDPIVIQDVTTVKLEDVQNHLLLVIVDERQPNKAKVRDAMLHLRKIAEVSWGCRVICLNKENLLSLYYSRHDPAPYFPATVQDKVNYMLGSQNFKEVELEKALGSGKTMLVGAHVAHPSQEGEYCPSVAAVVAIKTGSNIRYQGTASLQTTTSTPAKEPRGDSTFEETPPATPSRHINGGIVDLQTMMRNLLNSWKDDLPAEVIVFRDSADLLADAIAGPKEKSKPTTVMRECNAIEAAYNELNKQKGQKLKLAYLLVTKMPTELIEWHNFTYLLADGDTTKKYKYVIIQNGTGRTDAQLAEITGRLNESSQLNAHIEQTSKALPTLYASKLCSRMQDYIRLSGASLEPAYKPKSPDATQIKREIAHQERVVKAVLGKYGLDTGNPEARQVPWHPKLDDTMFYL